MFEQLINILNCHSGIICINIHLECTTSCQIQLKNKNPAEWLLVNKVDIRPICLHMMQILLALLKKKQNFAISSIRKLDLPSNI